MTRSAVLHQRLAPKRHLGVLITIAAEVSAAGVVCAHSGTMLGIMLDEREPDHQARLASTRMACLSGSPATTVIRAPTFQETELTQVG